MIKLSSRYRSLLAKGASVLTFSFLLLFGTGCKGGENTDKNKVQPTTTEVSTTCTTSLTTSTSSSLTTSSTTTNTSTTTTELTTTEQIVTTAWENLVQTEPVYVEPQIEYVQPITEYVTQNDFGYSESDAVLLAQLINKEASATYDGKVAVGSVVINRANYYGQSITDVIYAPGQFTTAYSLGYYTTDDYNAAVQVLTSGSVNNAFYFDGAHPDHLNHFRDINNNYVGAW